MGTEPDFGELEREMARQIESGLRPSIQVAVDFRGELVFERALGAGATIDSTYVLWSSTKPLVAVALLQLIEEGRAALDDRVSKHVPEFGKLGKERCTLAHVLTHRGGFPDSKPATRAELLRISRDWDASLDFVCNMEALWEPWHRPRLSPALGLVRGRRARAKTDGRPLADAPMRACSSRSACRATASAWADLRICASRRSPRVRALLGPLRPRARLSSGAPRRMRRAFPARSESERATLAAFYRAPGRRKAKQGEFSRPRWCAWPRSRTWSASATARCCATCRGSRHAPEHVLPAVDDCGTRATPGTLATAVTSW
jgi:hypothetical protein